MTISLIVILALMLCVFGVSLWREWQLSTELESRRVIARYAQCGSSFVKVWPKDEQAHNVLPR